MDSLDPSLPVPKTRRKHSREFKAMVVKACNEPGNSTAGSNKALDKVEKIFKEPDDA